MKKVKLTNKNYHEMNSGFITSSKIKDYKISPWFFYQKHILKTIESEKTDALIIGSGVDCYLTRGKKAFNRLFKPVIRRTNEEGLKYTEVPQAVYSEIVAISERVINTTAFKQLKDFEFQKVLTADHNGTPICGMLDAVKIKGDKAIIVDIKTSRTSDKRKYFYHALEYNYDVQAAMYIKLVRANYPEVKAVDFYHLVVSKENKNFYIVKTFKFNDNLLLKATLELDVLISEIANRKDWQPDDCSFEDAIELGAPLMAEKAEEGEWEEKV